jgi:hypothetical protein
MPLPKQKTPIVTDPTKFSVCVYGTGGIGKSTFASKADGALFLATEPGLNSLEVYQVTVESIDDMDRVYAEILAGGHDFRMVVVDTVDRVHHLFIDAVCKELGITYPRGKMGLQAWGMINNRFRNWVIKMTQLPVGVMFISHCSVEELEKRTGTVTYTSVGLPKTSRKVFTEAMDIVLYAELVQVKTDDGVEERRILRSQPTVNCYAKDRTGRLPATIDLNYGAFEKAFKTATNPTKKGK